MTIVKMDDLKPPAAPRPRPSSGVVVTDPNGRAVRKTPHPELSIDNLDLGPEAMEERKKKHAAAMEVHLETLRQRCEKSGVKIFHPRRKK